MYLTNMWTRLHKERFWSILREWRECQFCAYTSHVLLLYPPFPLLTCNYFFLYPHFFSNATPRHKPPPHTNLTHPTHTYLSPTLLASFVSQLRAQLSAKREEVNIVDEQLRALTGKASA
jgi:hypothetical protein